MIQVLVASDSAPDVALIRRLLEQEGFDAEGCVDATRLAAEFERARPQVLVLAFKSMEAAERHYLGLYRHSQLVNSLPHRTLLLCQIEHSRDAYERCRAGVFDDYLPFWPMAQDGWMLPKAIHLALRAIDGQRQAAALAQMATQARRISGLEAMLDAQIAVGNQHAQALLKADETAQADVGAAIKELERRIVDSGLDDALMVRDAVRVRQAIDRMERQSLQPAMGRVTRAITPLKQWADGLKEELAVPVDAARTVTHQTQALRPRILVVDDDRIISYAVEQVLGEAGYEVLLAGDAAHAMRALRQTALDLVMLDVGLPDINGIDLLRRMKAHPELAALPVLMLTGNSDKGTIVESKAAGASDLVVKPFSREVLLMKVDRLLGARGAPGTVRHGGRASAS